MSNKIEKPFLCSCFVFRSNVHEASSDALIRIASNILNQDEQKERLFEEIFYAQAHHSSSQDA